jgi:hypothetical protein
MIANCAASSHAISHAIASVPDAGAPSVSALETWYVATNSGTRAMTLDELDEALERGEVDTSTRLWIPGMAEWEALGTVANLEDGPPLECTPGAMLEYGLDAERAAHSEDGSVRPGAGDIRDYDPFSFPPPAENIPDPNGALWASVLPPAAEPTHTGATLTVQPWWRAEGRMPWVGLMLSGCFVLCMSLLGIARLLFASPVESLHTATLALAPEVAALAVTAAPSEALAGPAEERRSIEGSAAGDAPIAAPALIRYDEPENAPRVASASTSRVDKAVAKRKPPAARAAVTKRASRPSARR